MAKFVSVIFCFITSLISYAQYYEWANSVQLGGSGWGRDIDLDSEGDVITMGRYDGTKDLDPSVGEELVTSNGEDDVFVQKLTADGDFVWGLSYGGTDNDWAFAMDTDSEGNVYIGGFFYNTIDFDPGIGIENRTAVNNRDAYVLKLNSDGEFVWVHNFGSFGWDQVLELTVDAAGNVLVATEFSSVYDFDPGDGVTELDNSLGNLCLLRLTSDREFISANQIGATSSFMGMTLDDDENIYLTGAFGGTYDFDPGPGVTELTSAGWSDIFVSKLTYEGELVWAKSYGGFERDYGESIAVDPDGNVLVTGHFEETVYFDFGIFDYTLHAAPGGDEEDAFILKLSPDGETEWARRIGGPEQDRGYAVLSDTEGNVYFGGHFENTADLHPSPFIEEFHVAGVSEWNRAWFFEKLNPAGELEWMKIINFSGSQEVNDAVNDADGNIYLTGRYNSIVDFDPGPGEHILAESGTNSYVLKLSECGITAETLFDTTCYSYTVASGDETYYETGVYYDTIPSEGGCSLVQTINVQINPVFDVENTVNACFEYTQAGWDTTYFEDAIHVDSLLTTSGCDSVVTTNLIISPGYEMDVTLEGTTLSVAEEGETYQWVDCNDGFAEIDEATEQSYEVLEDGSYAVIVSDGECTDTSDCFVFEGLSISEFETGQFKVYPNPTNGSFQVVSKTETNAFLITDMQGNVVLKKSSLTAGAHTFELDVTAGIYLLQFTTIEGCQGIIKLIVQ